MITDIEVKYVNLISSRLEKFSHVSRFLWNFRCPYCGDSKKKKNKKRGYLYEIKGNLNFKCHNCQFGTTFSKFLEKIDPVLHANFIKEKYFNGNNTKYSPIEKPVEKSYYSITKNYLSSLESIDSLDNSHKAKLYISNRKIPKEFWSDLYLVENYSDWVNDFLENKLHGNTSPRIVIPYRNKEGVIVGVQGRDYLGLEIRYLKSKFNKDEEMLYNSNNVDWGNTVYVTEGPFDAMFLENCVAVGSSNLKSNFDKDNVVLIYDNDKRNREIVREMEQSINEGFKVFIWPDLFGANDLNELALIGMKKNEIINLVEKNVFDDPLITKLKFSNWRKV